MEEQGGESSSRIMVVLVQKETRDTKTYRVKPNTRFFKLKHKYSKETGLPLESLRFTYDSRDVRDLETLRALGMTVSAEVLVRMNRVEMPDEEWETEGRPSENVKAIEDKDAVFPSETIIVRVVYEEKGKMMMAKIKINSQLKTLRKDFSHLVYIPLLNLRFMYKDSVVKDEDTPERLGMRSNDTIKVSLALGRRPVDKSSTVTIIVYQIRTAKIRFYRIHSSSTMSDVKIAYGIDVNRPIESLRFLYRRQLIPDEATPYDLQMEKLVIVRVLDGILDSILNPRAGTAKELSRFWAYGRYDPSNSFICCSYQSILRTKQRFSALSGWAVSSIRFWYQGKLILDTDTLESLGKTIDDIIIVTFGNDC